MRISEKAEQMKNEICFDEWSNDYRWLTPPMEKLEDRKTSIN